MSQGLNLSQSVAQYAQYTNMTASQLGNYGESKLKEIVGGGGHNTFITTQGKRIIDVYYNGIAYESKVGYTSLTQRVKEEILKDAELVKQGIISKAEWHFFESPNTGLKGATKNLLKFLEDNGITSVIH